VGVWAPRARWRIFPNFPQFSPSWNQHQTLTDYLCCHIYCAYLGTPWDQIVGAFRAVSNRESWYPHTNTKIGGIMNTLRKELEQNKTWKNSISQGPTLVLISWLDKLELVKWFEEWPEERKTSQVDKLTSLSCGTCYIRKKIWHWQKKLRIASASPDFSVIILGVLVFLQISVFGWTRCEIWQWHNPPPTSFSLYKHSQSGKNSTQNTWFEWR